MRRFFVFGLILAVAAALAACTFKPDPKLTAGLTTGTYAYFHTSMGDFVAKLYTDKTPKTTANFIGLAEGTKPFTEPLSKKQVQRPYFDGLIFHRIVGDFVIQGGDPLGTGVGGPGYKFEDEFHPDLRHSKKGIMSMANSGPNSNGSQFFFTLRPTPELDDKHTVFGEIVAGMDVIDKIAAVPSRADRPIRDVVMKKVRIIRVK